MSLRSAICEDIRAEFSGYLDGAVSGKIMHGIATHLRSCNECSAEFESLRSIQAALASLAPVKAPPDLPLRLRVAISNWICQHGSYGGHGCAVDRHVRQA